MPVYKQRRAVALRYDPVFPAPFIVARGRGRSAERIVELAGAAGVPVVRNDEVAGALELLEAGDLVPPAFWELVATVLVAAKAVATKAVAAKTVAERHRPEKELSPTARGPAESGPA